MIIQSSNEPIILTFTEDAAGLAALRVTLWQGKQRKIREWTLADVIVEGETVSCPLTQAETARFPAGPMLLEVKWLDTDGVTEFAETMQIMVCERLDKTVMAPEV